MTDERLVTLTMPAVQAPGRIPDQPCADCLDQSPAAERTRPGVPRRAAFWLLAFVFAATMLGTTLPTPLYDIYQAQWHFSAAIVTVTFAVYAAGVLLTLLLTGRASDQAGRKPVLTAALGCSALSTVVFILAPNVGVLMAGRILSGFSAGLMTGTATATLTELIPAWARSSPGSSPSTVRIPRCWCSRCIWRCWRSRACACSWFRKR
jgi:Major Facilitator Superfamily